MYQTRRNRCETSVSRQPMLIIRRTRRASTLFSVYGGVPPDVQPNTNKHGCHHRAGVVGAAAANGPTTAATAAPHAEGHRHQPAAHGCAHRPGQGIPAADGPASAVGRCVRSPLQREPDGPTDLSRLRREHAARCGRSSSRGCKRMDHWYPDAQVCHRGASAGPGGGAQRAHRGRPESRRRRTVRRRLLHRLCNPGPRHPAGRRARDAGHHTTALHRSHGLLCGAAGTVNRHRLRTGAGTTRRGSMRGAAVAACTAVRSRG